MLFVHKFVKDKARVEEDSFSGNLQPTGRILGFIRKEFHKNYENIMLILILHFQTNISFACFILWDSYNPNIKKEEGKKAITQKERGEKENIIKKNLLMK